MTLQSPLTGVNERGGCEAATPWHDHDWDAILAGDGFADRYFLRAGLVRKDRLTAFVPREHQPETAVVRSFQELRIALQQFNVADSEEGASMDDVQFVLKKAQSSNASGMRFLSGHDARAVTSGARIDAGPRCATVGSLACSAGAAAAAAVAVAEATVAWRQGRASTGATFWTRAVSETKLKVFTYAVLATLTSLAFPVAVGTATVTSWLRGYSSSLKGPSSQAVATELQNAMSPGIGKGNKERASIWVLQRHIEPWLHCGRKFHLRALLLCVGDLQAYLHKDVRMLVATEPFTVGRRDASRVFALVTNMGASGRHEEYNRVAQNLPLEALGEDISRTVFDGIGKVLGATLVRVRDAGRRHFFTTPNCWELFGADFLVEGGSGRVILLEINPSPSLAMYGVGGGPEVRRRLVGTNPLQDVPTGWQPVPLIDASSSDAAECSRSLRS